MSTRAFFASNGRWAASTSPSSTSPVTSKSGRVSITERTNFSYEGLVISDEYPDSPFWRLEPVRSLRNWSHLIGSRFHGHESHEQLSISAARSAGEGPYSSWPYSYTWTDKIFYPKKFDERKIGIFLPAE